MLNDDFSMWQFRGGLIKELVASGAEVVVIVPPGPYGGHLQALGAKVTRVPMERYVSPWADLRMFVALYRAFRREGFDVVHTMTIKPNVFGTIAAQLAGVPRCVSLVSGRGGVLAEGGSYGGRVIGWLGRWLYRVALSWSDRTWFQNPDDFSWFCDQRLIREAKGVVIRSGGIDTKMYAPGVVPQATVSALRRELGIEAPKRIVLMLARLIWSKGVREFVEAASALRTQYTEWVFVMLCPREPDSPDAVPAAFLERNRPENLVVVDCFREDAKTFVAMADIVTLPSYYPEGVPRSLLEGLAMGKPIVTTQSAGCREAVEDERNGFLVPPRDSRALAEGLGRLMGDGSLRERFGEASRQLAIREFDETSVVRRIIDHVYNGD